MFEEKENKSELINPNIASFLAIVAIAALFVGHEIYHESRPDITHSYREELIKDQDVEARLWQDPFDAIAQYKQNISLKNAAEQVLANDSYEAQNIRESRIGENCDADDPREKRHCRDAFFSGFYQKNPKAFSQPKQTEPEYHLNVLAIMLPGGIYFEDSELRRRMRYAVLTGFNAAIDFKPKDPEHIGYFVHHFSESDQSTSGHKKNSKIAYEILEHPPIPIRASSEPTSDDTTQSVLVLYLNNEDFEEKPYEKLKNLLSELKKTFPANDTSASKDKKFIIDVNILGPTSSDVLQDLVNELSVLTTPTPDAELNIKFYSPGATIDEKELLGSVNCDTDTDTSNNCVTNKLESLFKKSDTAYVRTTASDNEIAAVMANELKIRELIDSKKRIVLLSEKDTLYGQRIGKSYKEAIIKRNETTENTLIECKNGNLSQDNPNCYEKHNIHQYTYLRGLDGEKFRKTANAGESGTSSANSEEAQATRSQEMEDADDDSQFDYIRRLSRNLEEEDYKLRQNGESIAAIGILGSDVYDKLLVLEALHDKLPQALFFTNDLDARFLHPEQTRWARNLIVASNFGLELPPCLQKDVLPFRSSLQTGYFWATQLALAQNAGTKGQVAKNHKIQCLKAIDGSISNESAKNPEDFMDIKKELLKKKTLYEIGRSKIFELNPDTITTQPPTSKNDQIENPETDNQQHIHAEQSNQREMSLRLQSENTKYEFDQPSPTRFYKKIEAYILLCFVLLLIIFQHFQFRLKLLNLEDVKSKESRDSLLWINEKILQPIAKLFKEPETNLEQDSIKRAEKDLVTLQRMWVLGTLLVGMVFGAGLLCVSNVERMRYPYNGISFTAYLSGCTLIILMVLIHHFRQTLFPECMARPKSECGLLCKWLKSLQPLPAIAISLLACLMACGCFIFYDPVTAEPLAFVEGVSMWPTEAVGFLVLIISGYFVIEITGQQVVIMNRLKDRFNFKIKDKANQKVFLKDASQGEIIVNQWLEKCSFNKEASSTILLVIVSTLNFRVTSALSLRHLGFLNN